MYQGNKKGSFLLFFFCTILLLLFCNEPAKKLHGVCTLTAEPFPSPMRTSMLLAGPPLPRSSVCTLWMTPWYNCLRQSWVRHCVRQLCETIFGHYTLKEKIWNSGISFWSKKWTSCAKDSFFRKTIDIIFMYLLTLFIMQNLKKTVRADPELWRHVIFWPKMTYLHEEIFSEKPLI